MFYIYILHSLKDNNLYVGYTSNLRRRLNEHQNGLSQSTKYRTPLELIYYEAYKIKQDALEREKFFKSGWGRNYINKKILKNFLRENKSKNLGGEKWLA